MLASGLLYDVMQVTTPTGWRITSEPNTPALLSTVAGAIDGGARSTGSRAPFAYRLKRAYAVPTCIIIAVCGVAPDSAAARAGRSPPLNSRSAARSRIAARCSGADCDHVSNAFEAASAAACACSTDASGARPTTSSVAGLMTS